MTLQWPKDTPSPDKSKVMVRIGDDDLRKLPALNPGHLFICGLEHRPNVPQFCVELEATYFPPGTDKNDDLDFCVIKYPPDDQLVQLWPCVIIPSQYEAQARMLAAKLGLVMVSGTAPHCVMLHKGERSEPEFPLPPADNVFTLRRV